METFSEVVKSLLDARKASTPSSELPKFMRDAINISNNINGAEVASFLGECNEGACG